MSLIKENGKYQVVYTNDVGPHDDYFMEWWEVQIKDTEEVLCECKTEELAIMIMNLLAGNPPDNSLRKNY